MPDFRQVRLRDAHAPRQLGQRHPAFKHDAVEMHHNMRIIEALYHIRHSPSTMASAAHAMASVHPAHMQGGPLFRGPPIVPPVGLEPTCRGSAHPAIIVGIRRFSLAGVRLMRPRPFFQSLPVFTCFDRGLRFFVSKLCPNSLGTRLKLPPRSSSYLTPSPC